MSNGERIIVKLDPDYNPTGKPMPDTLLKKIKADPDFAKLSEEEQKNVINKVKNMVKDVEDVEKYGTLKEKLMKVADLEAFSINKKAVPYVILSKSGLELEEEPEYVSNEILEISILVSRVPMPQEVAHNLLKEGSQVNAGQCVLDLMAVDKDTFEDYFINDEPKIAVITAPISGKVFSLCNLRNFARKVDWNDDLFIVSSIPDDTREEAIKWYKETTGKEPKYKTKEDKKKEAATKKANVDNYLSKWDL